MTEKPENPQAFPYPASSWYRGMTLRDYFAGQALAGIASASYGHAVSYGELAEDAFTLADMMLAERGKP